MAESQSMTAAEVVAKTLISEHADFLREAVALVAAQLMETEITEEIGAGHGEVSAERQTHRNGYRPRAWETRVGEIDLLVPRKRSGEAYFPSFLEPRRPCEQAIVAVVMEAYVNGVSTRKVDRLVEQLGIQGMSKDRVSALCRGLAGVRLCASDHHEGLKTAIARILGCPWQRCTVHFVRNMHGHCRRSERGIVSAALREIFAADGLEQAKARLGEVLERFRGPLPKLAELLEAAEEDLLAFYCFPAQHWSKLRSTNPLERLNKEIGRRSDVVGIFPNDAAALRLTGALLIEQNDEWLVCRRYLFEESLALVLEDQGDQDREEVPELQAA